MIEKYNNYIINASKNNPQDYMCKVNRYLQNILNFYEQNESLALVEILDILNENKEKKEFIVRFSDLYKRYPIFIVSKLDPKDRKFIINRYQEELQKWKEELHAI